jgi:hypothetical protein
MSKSTGKTEAFVYQAVREGTFEISASGEVWRTRPKRRRVDLTTSNGYRMVKLMRGRKQVTTMAHRLVFLHFNSEIPPGLTINHKNGIRGDNRPENLELATYAEQVRHAVNVLGRKPKVQDGEANDMAKLTAKVVREIRRRRAAGESLTALAKDFGVAFQTVSKIARGERWASIK